MRKINFHEIKCQENEFIDFDGSSTKRISVITTVIPVPTYSWAVSLFVGMFVGQLKHLEHH